MDIPQWVLYAATVAVVLYSLSLMYWAYRVFMNEHPLDAPTQLSWASWLILVFALLGFEVPKITIFVTLVMSFAAGLIHPYIGWGCLILAGVAALLYLYTDARDARQSKARLNQVIV